MTGSAVTKLKALLARVQPETSKRPRGFAKLRGGKADMMMRLKKHLNTD